MNADYFIPARAEEIHRPKLAKRKFIKIFQRFSWQLLVLTMLVFTQCVFAEERTNASPLVVNPIEGKSKAGVAVWLESSLKRVFLASAPGSTNLNLLAARNGKISFQVCLRNREIYWQHIECSLAGADDLKSQVRLVGFVPVQHFTGGTDPSELDGIGFLPGLVPDPLMPQTAFDLGSQESRSFWVTLEIPPDVKPGVRELKVKLSIQQLFIGNPKNGKVDVELPVKLEISSFVIQPLRSFSKNESWIQNTVRRILSANPAEK